MSDCNCGRYSCRTCSGQKISSFSTDGILSSSTLFTGVNGSGNASQNVNFSLQQIINAVIAEVSEAAIVATEVTADYTQTVNDEYIFVDASAGSDITITTIPAIEGRTVTVIKTSATGGDVIIQPPSGNIQNNTSLTIAGNAQVGSIQAISTSTAWWVK